MQIVLTEPERRELERALRESGGLSWREAKKAVWLVASFLAQRDAEEIDAPGSKTYWKDFVTNLFERSPRKDSKK